MSDSGEARDLARLRALVENSIAPLDLLDRNGVVLYSSPARERPLGHPNGLVGRNAFELVHPDDADRVGNLFQALLREPGGQAQAQFRARHRDGSWRWISAAATNLLDEPNVQAIVLSSRDVTTERRAEAELRLSDRLASIGILAAGVGHEINNPLNYVLSNLDLVAQRLTPLSAALRDDPAQGVVLAELRAMIERAHEGAERIARIVKGLHVLSRPEPEQASPVDVESILDSSIALAGGEIRPRARVERTRGDLPPVLGDESRLAQVFVNLLVNAAQAIEERRSDGVVRIVTGVTADSDRVVVEVRDNGAGIDPLDLPHIFDPFFTTKSREAGTGLGLSISRRIVTALGGSIEAESAPGEGAVFRVLLPRATPDSIQAEPAKAPDSNRRRVLVVDDEVQTLRALEVLLGGAHDVATSTSAREALALLKAGARFDVILCDLMMPDMTGMDLFEALADVDEGQQERVVFITGGAFTPRARHFLDTVSNRCLEKPFALGALERVLA